MRRKGSNLGKSSSNTCDVFLWGYLKQRADRPLPKSIQNLKYNIKREKENIDENF